MTKVQALIQRLRSEAVPHLIGDQHLTSVRDVVEQAIEGFSPQLLPLIGPSRVGKSNLLKQVAAGYPSQRIDGTLFVPVLHLVLRPGASSRTLPSDVSLALGQTIFSRSSTGAELRWRMEKQLELARTKVLLIDEASHLADEGRKQSVRASADWLKSLMDGMNISIVLSGIPRLLDLLESNEQLCLRARAPEYFMPYDCMNKAHYQAFAQLVWTYMSWFQEVGFPIAINDQEFIDDCLMLSGGLVGVLNAFLLNLCNVLRREGPRSITLEDCQHALAITSTHAPENCLAFGAQPADRRRQRAVYVRTMDINRMPQPTLG